MFVGIIICPDWILEDYTSDMLDELENIREPDSSMGGAKTAGVMPKSMIAAIISFTN